MSMEYVCDLNEAWKWKIEPKIIIVIIIEEPRNEN